jgi:hypothetical protein
MSAKLFETTIVCIRHGESEANVLLHRKGLEGKHDEATRSMLRSAGDDPALTPRGVEQARATERHLRAPLETACRQHSVQVCCSPLRRANETLQAFKTDESMPLFVKNVEVLPNMLEYDTETHGTAAAFVDQVLRLFRGLRRKCESAVAEPRTLMLFGHSLVFSTLLHVAAVSRPGLSDDAHREAVLEKLCDKKNVAYLNVVYQLPNCSVSVLRATHRNGQFEWCVLGAGKDDHLRALGLNTGNKSDF